MSVTRTLLAQKRLSGLLAHHRQLSSAFSFSASLQQSMPPWDIEIRWYSDEE
jgi:hypothetical protein